VCREFKKNSFGKEGDVNTGGNESYEHGLPVSTRARGEAVKREKRGLGRKKKIRWTRKRWT